MDPPGMIRKHFPDATNAEIDEILWMHTGFPQFAGNKKKSPFYQFKTAIERLKRCRDKDSEPCIFCNEPSSFSTMECTECFRAINEARENGNVGSVQLGAGKVKVQLNV